MSEKGRIAAIFGAVAVVAGGGLYYFFKVHTPKQQRAAAQAEIAAWEKRLDAARSCLFGATPASGDSGEALAVRELTPDPWDRGTCTQLIARLNRGVADDTGLLPVEHAWMSIDRAAAKVASSFATHVDPFGEAPANRRKDSPLPAALLELDAAHADLRKAAGMEPPPTATLPRLPAAELIRLAHGEDRVKSLDDWWIPSAGGSIAFGSTTKGQVQLVLVPGSAPKLAAVPHRALRAVPDLAWGTAGMAEQIEIAPVDDSGAFGAMTSVPVSGSPRVLAAVGTATAGLVVAYAEETGVVLVRSSGGAFTAAPPIPGTRAGATADPSGRVLVAWSGVPPTRDGARQLESDEPGPLLYSFISRGDAAPVPVELGTGYPQSMCLTDTLGWVQTHGHLRSFDGTTAGEHMLPGHELVACTRDAALAIDYEGMRYSVCNPSCEPVEITGLRATTVATVANGKVHAVRTRGRVLGVWRQSLPPKFFALPEKITPVQATSDGKVLDVLATTESGAVIARVPLD